MDNKSMKSKLKMLVVVCHPADAIDGAGGTICLHAQRGDEVTVAVCTHGVDTHDLRRNDKLRFDSDARLQVAKKAIENKEMEVRKGLKVLGVTDVRFLRFEDSLLLADRQLIESIAGVLADVQPHILIVHNPTEELGIADVGHAESAIATLKARYLANTKRFLKKPSGRTFPSQVFFLVMNGQTTLLSSLGRRYGSVLVDITSVVEKKVKAMECLNSQYYHGHLARKCIEDVNGEMGLHWRIPYAEAFEALFPHAYKYLPMNEHLMWVSKSKTADQFKKMRIMLKQNGRTGREKS